MAYTFESRVRFSEVDHTEQMTLPSLVNYFQDCSTFQSEELGLGINTLKERKKAWVLSSWQIVVNRYPRFGERISTASWATGFDGFFGTRNFQMTDQEGQAAWANSVWIFMDIERGRPVRPLAQDVEAYGMEKPLEMEFAPRKIVLPKETLEQEGFAVRADQIDTNEHVNNCQYIQMASEVMPECARSGQIRVEYRKSAVLGDRIYPKTAVETDRKIVELCDAYGRPFAVIEFKENGQDGTR